MMKNLEIYENFLNPNFKFNIGDEVVCIQSNWIVYLELGETYTVEDRNIYSDINYYSV